MGWCRPKQLLAALLMISAWNAVDAFTPAPPTGLRLGDLGSVAVGGNFDAIQIYSYQGQQQGIQGNGTQAVLQQLPNGMYSMLAQTDANIEQLCSFTTRNGTFLGVIIAGNFTSVAGIGAQSVAFIDGRTGQISPHPGIQGTVNAVLCDSDTETAYLGGTFDAADSSNAIAWLATGSWANLPFAGFDAPVTAINKAPNGHIVFGGSFTGLKNMTTTRSNQKGELINLASATVASVANITNGGALVCPSNDSSTTPWQLQDNTPGSWTASLRYGFEPSRIRLYNNPTGKGVRTWRLTALPNTGIMNFTYTNPATGQTEHCDATCPLLQNASVPYQDFTFVNRVGMNSFRLDVSAWYGQGGALRGVELFQNDTFVYAIDAVSGPSCLASTNTLSTATTTGPWYQTPSRSSVADYLTVVVGPTTLDTTNIIFRPSVDEAGNYTVVVYTPGCIQDSSCSARGVVNVTGTLTTDGSLTFSTQLSQTNDYDKYDQVYQGPINPAARPAVTITPSKQLSAQLIVASRVRFSGNPSTGGLNGLFDFNPNEAVVNTDFSKSAINNAGTRLKENAQILAMAVHADTIYTGGGFSDDVFENIMSFTNNEAVSLANGGLNAAVADLYAGSDLLYVGGNFTGTANAGGPQGLNNVAAYDYAQKAWIALGNGVDGPVASVVPFSLNITRGSTETVIGLSGSFKNILATGSNPQHATSGFAVWVPSRKDWLQNLGNERQLLAGMLSSHTTLPNSTWLGAGTLISLGQVMSGVAGLNSNAQIQQLPINIEPATTESQSSVGKRALLTASNVSGIVTGAFDGQGGRDVTILAGHFVAESNGTSIDNLAFINNQNNATYGLPSGIDNNSTFLSLLQQKDTLFAGGLVTGLVNSSRVQGLVLYDLAAKGFRSPQPAALQGESVIVNSFIAQPDTQKVYVGGSFDSTSQGLACSTVCIYDTAANLWSAAGSGLDGVVTGLHFTDATHLIAVGNLSVSNTNTYMASYDTRNQSWSVFDTAQLPGPVSTFTMTSETDEFWVAGTTTSNNSAYLIKITGQSQAPVTGLLDGGTTVLGLELLSSQGHSATRYMRNDQQLLVMGQLNITGYGKASAALFNGTTMQPFILSVDSAGQAGSISRIFYSNSNPAITTGSFGHSNGLAILVAFCAALGTIFLIVLAGMLLNRLQRKRAGYSTVPGNYQDKNTNISRVPPERLFASMGQRTPGAPNV